MSADLTEDDISKQQVILQGVCHDVHQLLTPIRGPLVWQEKTGQDSLQVAAVAFWDRYPEEAGAKLVNFQAFRDDYAHLCKSIEWDITAVATHISFVVIDSPELLNRPGLLTITGYGMPVLRDPDKICKVVLPE